MVLPHIGKVLYLCADHEKGLNPRDDGALFRHQASELYWFGYGRHCRCLVARDGWLLDARIWHAAPLGQLTFITFILFPVAGLVTLLARVKEEEVELRKRFKKEWDQDWAVHVPYILIHGII